MIFSATLWPLGQLSLPRIFLIGLHLSIIIESGSLNLLEPSELVQDSTWIAFVFFI